MKILCKSDIGRMPALKKAGIDWFELYIRNSQDLEEKIDGLASIHFHYKLDDGRIMDLSDSGELGDASQMMLKKVVECAKKNKVDKIVIHPPGINRFKISPEEARRIFLQRLEAVYDPQVEFCLENVCFWIKQIYLNESLFTKPEEFLQMVKESKIPLGLVFDVEHFLVTKVMEPFYDQYKARLELVHLGKIDYSLVEKEFEAELAEYVKQRDLNKTCHEFLQEALQKLKSYVRLIHCSGSDCHNYYYSKKTVFPMIGEHLPLHFKGLIEGYLVQDRLDHTLWIKELQPRERDLDIVLELGFKDDYDFVKEFHNSKEIVKNLLKQ